MSSPTPLLKAYSITSKNRVRTIGYAWRDEDSCREYFGRRIVGRLKEGDGSEFLRKYLERMPDTGFSLTHLRVEAAQSKPPRDWEVGEAFAESVLEDYFDCLFPWPTSRDQREKEGHPTGPDLPGYHLASAKPARFAFGEVKSSSQNASPPAVVSGVDGRGGKETLVGQLRRLLTEPARRQILIAWLGFRRTFEANGGTRFDSALKRYGETGECLIAGCLVSGKRAESETDLADAQSALEANVSERELWLFAFYLPFEKADWPSLVAATGGQA
jgi:hypothetical protein